jgi:TolB protein
MVLAGAAVIGAGVALAIVLLVPSGGPPLNGTARRYTIAFIRNGRLYFMKGDGSNQRSAGVRASDPVYVWWSPGGRKIAVSSERSYAEPMPPLPPLRILDIGGSGQRVVSTRLIADAVFAGWSPDGRRIAFSVRARARYDSAYRLEVMNADGSGRHAVTPYGCLFGSYWSPLGGAIAFVVWPGLLYPDDDPRTPVNYWRFDGGCEPDGPALMAVFAVSVGGRYLSRLTLPFWGGVPTWSPDGRTIVVNWNKHGLLLVGADGQSRRVIPHTRDAAFSGEPGPDAEPEWSRDGKRIFYFGNGTLFVVRTDGTGKRNLTSAPDKDREPPVLSRDGKKVFYLTAGGLFVANVDGTGKRDLTPTLQSVTGFALSPDGRRIAVSGGDGKVIDIFLLNADGSGLRALSTRRRDASGGPEWSPDGSVLAFTRYVTRSPTAADDHIYLVNADGSALTDVTPKNGHDALVGWRPVPTSAAHT